MVKKKKKKEEVEVIMEAKETLPPDKLEIEPPTPPRRELMEEFAKLGVEDNVIVAEPPKVWPVPPEFPSEMNYYEAKKIERFRREYKAFLKQYETLIK